MKRKGLALLCIVVGMTLTGCSSDNIENSDDENVIASNGNISIVQEEEEEVEKPTIPKKHTMIEVGVADNADALGLVKLMKDNDEENSVNIYNFKIGKNEDEISQMLAKGDLMVGILPLNKATELYKSTNGQVQIAAILNSVESENISCVVARVDYTSRHKNAFYFLIEEYKKSVEFANTNNEEAVKDAQKFKITSKEKKEFSFSTIAEVKDMLKEKVNGDADDNFYYESPFN